ncbi:MAG: hypothetical protein AB1896_21530, partial [Thermodesulfobacteriota bacterium]
MRPRTRHILALLTLAVVLPGVSPARAVELLVSPNPVERGGVAAFELVGFPERTGPSVSFEGRPAMFLNPVHPGLGVFGVGLSTEPGFHPLTVSWSGGGRRRSQTLLIQVRDHDYGTRHLNLQKDTLDLSEEERERVEQEGREVETALGGFTPWPLWRPPFIRPGEGEVTSGFGRRTLVNGRPRPQPHLGVDLRAATGSPILAPAAGRVALLGNHLLPGKTIYLDH